MKFKKMDPEDELYVAILDKAEKMGLTQFMDIQPRYMVKPQKSSVGAVYKWNDVSATLTGSDDTIVIGVYGEAFDRVDEETKDFWLDSILHLVGYDFEKDKIVVNKDLVLSLVELYQKYGEKAVTMKELEIHTIQMIAEEEKARKEEEKAAKKEKKGKKK